MEKTLRGTVYGSADVRRDFDESSGWARRKPDLDGMISQRLGLKEINKGSGHEGGQGIRSVVQI